MIVKIIQNLENRMELQINSLETRIEKMQAMFNEDLEEIKKSQSCSVHTVDCNYRSIPLVLTQFTLDKGRNGSHSIICKLPAVCFHYFCYTHFICI